ncbi:MAG: transcriptional activator NhaR [Comamonadaceae bacterium]|mgnify:FL=1|jgi:LysR family transcriptional activator of nhaA|uniref:transcriptional activator NhaR n=1 Tax=Candidatus Skiveiella danica TaxID=3386177 RepID=UPI0009D47CA1|nr:transcriptional activator NhaR [Comamonadaceae bacterium]MBK9197937.1 transcriptional activator NhaR [Betaproteobacteria bacterium]MBP8102014.1 transcriptional activator NhaR [Burkholderiaceae bacterium]OQC16797.1 MAG: Transcriptional activator protein NhaR [Alphaproteobacteria bacterium ADurb.Bin100]MBK6928491.1 transcriptional activator NhaR [Comamonadaceae bacterium]
MNFKHLYYFWVAAKAGGVMRAGEQLHTTPQTLSGQIKLLEQWLGRPLFRKSGRQLELTSDGQVALGYADEIFALGAQLEGALRQPRGGQRMLEFRVGVADSVAKSVAYRLLEPALSVAEPVRLIGSEGKFPDLLAQLALHRLDLVIADEPLSRRVSVKAFNHPLGATVMSFFATPALAATLQGGFPQCLDGAPMLIQGAASSVRQQLEGWLARHQLRPRVVGEFDDGALMTAFGREGRGVFMSPTVLEAETIAQFGVEVIGRSNELVEEFFAVSVERRITHPCVVAITQVARRELFSS